MVSSQAPRLAPQARTMYIEPTDGSTRFTGEEPPVPRPAGFELGLLTAFAALIAEFDVAQGLLVPGHPLWSTD